MSIFPNPANTEVTVTFGYSIGANTTISAHDFSGRLICKRAVRVGARSIVVDTRNWNSGVYLIQLHNRAGENTAAKLVISH
jgi:hypothetical protein